ncbi:hypothetical protein CMO89_04000 [Candidatus Woesearchaeota archaeon]|nr:hypothetical protein [Candidatus Woesearchaeota archaeon]
MDDIRHKLVTEVTVSTAEILDPKVIASLKEKFRVKAEQFLKEKLPKIDDKTKNLLVGLLLHEMVGLGNIEFLLNDDFLEEIIVNSASEPIRVYHKKYGWLETNVSIDSEVQIQNYANTIARRVGKQVTTLNPLLDAHLVTGDRANAVLYPISNRGNTITIRKFARDPWTVTDLITNKTSNPEIFALVWLAIQYEMNILISGGTGSGKTSFLNVVIPFIPPNHRIISIEDTRELQLPKFLYWCPLVTRQPNHEGKGAVTELDLLINSLRMRPDRIILGEMRRKEQAEVLFEAMHTGHSVYATVHADSINETIQRLVNPPIEVPSNLLKAVNLNVVMFRDRRRSIRRIYQIGEFVTTEGSGKSTVKPNLLYRWKPSTDKIIFHGKSVRLFEELSRHTGMSQSEINNDLKTKTNILNYMVKNKIRDINAVGKIISDYSLDRESLISSVNKNIKPGKVI